MRPLYRIALLSLAPLGELVAGSLLDPIIPAIIPGNQAFGIERVVAYEGRWQQFDRGSGAPLSSYAESLAPAAADGVEVLEHRIVMELPNAARVVTVTHHDHASLAPLKIDSRLIGGSPERPSQRTFEFTDSGYTVRTRGPEEQVSELQVSVSVKGFNASNFGLAIAGLPLAAGYRARLPALMPQLQGSYWTVIEVTGETAFSLPDGTTIDAWLVDVNWLHLESGDIYPGGAEGSGGTYTIAKRIEAGHPRVLRYLTDTSDVRLVEITGDRLPAAE